MKTSGVSDPPVEAPAGPLPAWLVRRFVVAICLAGVVGMIVGAARDNNAIGMVSGLITATAIALLIVLTSVLGDGAFSRRGTDRPAAGQRTRLPDERVASEVEARIRSLVEGGADETALRQLVTKAIELGGGAMSPRASAGDQRD